MPDYITITGSNGKVKFNVGNEIENIIDSRSDRFNEYKKSDYNNSFKLKKYIELFNLNNKKELLQCLNKYVNTIDTEYEWIMNFIKIYNLNANLINELKVYTKKGIFIDLFVYLRTLNNDEINEELKKINELLLSDIKTSRLEVETFSEIEVSIEFIIKKDYELIEKIKKVFDIINKITSIISKLN